MVEGEGFAKEDGLQRIIRKDKPLSADTWFDIADEHPEFFRRNGDRQNVALLIRSYSVIKGLGTDTFREPLSITETQKMIDAAISLHDKEIARSQKYSYLVPVLTTLLGALLTLGTQYVTSRTGKSSDKELIMKIDSVQRVMQNIENKIQ